MWCCVKLFIPVNFKFSLYRCGKCVVVKSTNLYGVIDCVLTITTQLLKMGGSENVNSISMI